MTKINKHIEIVSSSDKYLSSMSSKARGVVKAVLEKYYTNVGITLVNDSEGLEQLIEKNPDLVFTGMKQVPIGKYSPENDEYVWVSGFLEDRGVTVTGSDPGALELELDKTKAKDVIKAANLTTSPYFIAKVGEYTDESQLPFGFPMFLKPHNRGAGTGIDDNSVVRSFDEFLQKMKSLAAESITDVLVERYLSGREFTVGVLWDANKDELMIMPIEQLPIKNERGDCVIGYEMKDAKAETAVGVIEEGEIKQAVISLAQGTFEAVGARDYGRIDIRLDENSVPHFLEVNLIPGMVTASGNFPKAFKINTGRSYDEMLLHIVHLALNRADLSTNATAIL